jgi:hypothetical protein
MKRKICEKVNLIKINSKATTKKTTTAIQLELKLLQQQLKHQLLLFNRNFFFIF